MTVRPPRWAHNLLEFKINPGNKTVTQYNRKKHTRGRSRDTIIVIYKLYNSQ